MYKCDVNKSQMLSISVYIAMKHSKIDFIRRIAIYHGFPVHYIKRIIMNFNSPLAQCRDIDFPLKVFQNMFKSLRHMLSRLMSL